MLAYGCRGCAQTYSGPLIAVVVMAAVLIGIVWLINNVPRWFSRRAELRDRGEAPPEIKHRRYRFDDRGTIIGHDDD